MMIPKEEHSRLSSGIDMYTHMCIHACTCMKLLTSKKPQAASESVTIHHKSNTLKPV